MGMTSEPRERLIAAPGRRQTAAGVVVALAGPVLITVLASIPAHSDTAVPALLYLLAVVAAAAVGHLWPGLMAAALSFFALDYYFTPPRHTITVSKAEDLVALAVFLVVAAIVSTALSTALEQRARAEFREHQVRALYQVTARLLSGASLEMVLHDVAASLASLYQARGSRLMVFERDGVERNEVVIGTIGQGEVVSVPLVAEGTSIGQIEIWDSPGRGIGGPEGEVLTAFAGQLALALERARLGALAATARVEAEASRTRAALFSSVTHDLRTPLASITASASSLLEEGVPFSEGQRDELLRTILEEAQRLNRLVANLMDLSRLRAGALVPSPEPVMLEDIIWPVIERLRPGLEGREVRVVVREGVPPVPVDVVQIDQVFTNLVENAARFSPAATPITISAARWESKVEVRVSDRGPGIHPSERDRVFQEFYRRDVGEGRSGTGLGLAIARAIVVAHGGSMWIEDTPGGGATVGFRLPLGRSGAGSPRPAEAMSG